MGYLKTFVSPLLQALEQWVNAGDAPSLFIAAHMNEKKEITATRPICRYPLEARYLGHGDTKEAANFACRAPQPM